jgi:hypothetical protein
MTEDVPHLNQIRSRFNHVGRRIVPQVMPFEYARKQVTRKRRIKMIIFEILSGPAFDVCPAKRPRVPYSIARECTEEFTGVQRWRFPI